MNQEMNQEKDQEKVEKTENLENKENKTLTNNDTDDRVPKDVQKKRNRKKSTLDRLEEVKERRKRAPLYSQNRFNIKPEPGYHYRVVSDNEYEYCISRGYEPDPNYKSQKFQAGRSKDPSQIGSARVSLGGDQYGTVMRIKQEFYDEDQKEKHDRDKRRQADLMRQNTENMDKRGVPDKLEIKTVNYEDL